MITVVGQPAFFGLATNHDGSVLWFSTPLRMRGTEQPAHSKVFTRDPANGVRLFRQMAASLSISGPTYTSGPHNLIYTSVSADGTSLAGSSLHSVHTPPRD